VNIYDIDDHYKELFDFVIITIGALCWFDIIDSCIFEDNGIGLRFNSADSTTSCDGCYGSTFSNNEIAAYIIQVPGDLPFDFPEGTFEGNGEDIRK